MFPVCVKLPLFCGVVLVLYNSKSNAQYLGNGGYGGYGRSMALQNLGPGYTGGYTPGFGQDSSFQSYHREYNSVTLPDGSTKTEEIVRNSDVTPAGTKTYANTYDNDGLYGDSSLNTPGYTGPGYSPRIPQRNPTIRRPEFGDSRGCPLPMVKNGSFYYQQYDGNERIPSTPGRVESTGQLIYFECDRGFTASAQRSSFRCTNDGHWFPPLTSCVESGCPLPTVKNGSFYYRQYDGYERIPSTPGRVESTSQLIYFECDPGFTASAQVSSFRCTNDGHWFPPLTSCVETCTTNSQCPQGKFCVTNRCISSNSARCGIECGKNAECTMLNGRYTCGCVQGYLFSEDGCQPSSSFGCINDNECSQGKVCHNNRCKDPCGESCDSNSECKKVNSSYRCVCKNGFEEDPENGCQPIKRCPPLKFRNMKVTCKFQGQDVPCTSSMKPNTTATGKCNQFFKPDEDHSQLTCLSTGRWDHPQLSCVPDEELCPPLKSQHMSVKCKFQDNEVSCDNMMKPGTIATAECNQYYKPSREPHHSQSTCLPTGRWDYPLFKCTPVCGRSTEIGKPAPDLFTPLIIDGKQANVGTFPWHAGLYFLQGDTWIQSCGGSLITDQFVITAAHCVYKDAPVDIRIGLGKYYRAWDQIEDSQQTRNVSKVIYPPDFHKPTLYFDIALLRLDRSIEVGKFVMPACTRVLDESQSLLNEKLYISGWGQTKDVRTGSSSSTLLYNDVMFVPRTNCQRLIPQIISLFDKFCAVKNNNSVVSIAQPGDSGGGMTAVYNGLHYIFGIVSGKIDQVTMFTNVTWSTHVSWIENEIRQYDRNYRWNES